MGNELTKIDYDKLDVLSVASNRGAVTFERVGEMMDFAKLMSVSDIAVRKHLRNNAGACLAIVVQANEWGLSPFAVANKSFLVNDQMAYESQLLHAVIERRAPLKERLRFDFEGEGPDLMVRVTGHLRGEATPLVYESPRFKDIKVKNSPLWLGDPKQQFTYYGARAWGRRFVPDVLLGLYAEDELDNARNLGAENAKDVTPEEPLHHRLSAKAVASAGFDPTAIASTLAEVSGKKAEADSPKQTGAASQTASQAAADPEATSPVADEGAAANLSPPSVAEGASVEASPAAAEERSPAAADEIEQGSPGANPAEVERAAPTAPEAAAVPQSAAAAEPKSTKRHSYKPPAIPKDGSTYPDYVRDCLKGPNKDEERAVREWWNSDYEKSMRNRLPNLTQERLDECRGMVKARIDELKPKTEGDEV